VKVGKSWGYKLTGNRRFRKGKKDPQRDWEKVLKVKRTIQEKDRICSNSMNVHEQNILSEPKKRAEGGGGKRQLGFRKHRISQDRLTKGGEGSESASGKRRGGEKKKKG